MHFRMQKWGLALGALVLVAACGDGSDPANDPQQQLPPAPTIDPSRVLLQMAAPGGVDEVRGEATAVVGADHVVLFADADLAEELDAMAPGADGSFGPLGAGDNEHARLWVAARNERGLSAPVRLDNDIVPPTISFDAAPQSPSGSVAAQFEIACDEESCTLACALDDAALAPCDAAVAFDDLGEGPHVFRVQATDAAGNVSEPLRHEWTIDLVRPVVTITEKPANPGNEEISTFAFTCSLPDCTFECSIEGENFLVCTTPRHYELLPGSRSFAVRGRVGDLVGEPVAYEWVIDREAPTLTLDATPDAVTNDDDASFAFSCDDDECALRCRLDEGDFADCTSPKTYTSLANGDHRFEVEARDAAGNVAEAAWDWTIDDAAPTASFTVLPARNVETGVFNFACSEDDCTFTCSLDGETPYACTPPVERTGFQHGATHTFVVVPTDAAGNEGAARSHTWIVDRVAPTVTLPDAPTGTTGNFEAYITLQCDEPGCTFTCQVNGGAEQACSSPYFMLMTEGGYILVVRGTDPAGNTGEATAAWTVGSVPI